MNVASLELCKKLYELSGWEETRDYYHSLVSHDLKRWSEYKLQDYKPDNNFGMRLVPAYSLGYLLRKLPEGAMISKYGREYLVGWSKLGDGSKVVSAKDATPEDAACKLAIELFKQGILTREEKAL